MNVAAGISPILKRAGRKRRFGSGRAVFLGGEVAEADYTSLGHWSGVLRRKNEAAGQRDS